MQHYTLSRSVQQIKRVQRLIKAFSEIQLDIADKLVLDSAILTLTFISGEHAAII